MFHSFGLAKGPNLRPPGKFQPLGLKPVEKLADAGPLSFAISPRSNRTDGPFQVVWENSPATSPLRKASSALLDEKTYIRLWGLSQETTEVVVFAAPAPGGFLEEGEIDYVMLRRKANSTVFATVQEPWRESAGPKVSGMVCIFIEV